MPYWFISPAANKERGICGFLVSGVMMGGGSEANEMAKNERFEKVYSQGTMNVMEIWVDRETGVNYVFHAGGYAGGMTPLLDREGKPVISPVVNR